VIEALAAADGNVSRAANLLGVSRPTVYDLIQKLELASPGTEINGDSEKSRKAAHGGASVA
jgi:DNA-binding NtrC family response regulator